MTLGTKNRIIHNAVICRDHLRQQHQDKPTLVNEFIAEVEGIEGDTGWNQYTDLKRSEGEMIMRVQDAFQKWMNP